MNAFVRQVTVLTVLWSFCELLMPEGKQQQMVRMTVGLLVMTALISALTGLLGGTGISEWPAQAVLAEGNPTAEPERFVLQAAANQVQQYCQRVARRAGYDAEAVVYLRRDGSLEKTELYLAPSKGGTLLMDEQALAEALAQALKVEKAQIQLMAWPQTADAMQKGESP